MPWEFTANNGWVVGAFHAAWSAIAHGGTLAETLELAVRCGGDTDTVAAIAGSLAGVVYGAATLPAELTELLHGWWADGLVGSAQALSGMVLSAIGVGRR